MPQVTYGPAKYIRDDPTTLPFWANLCRCCDVFGLDLKIEECWLESPEKLGWLLFRFGGMSYRDCHRWLYTTCNGNSVRIRRESMDHRYLHLWDAMSSLFDPRYVKPLSAELHTLHGLTDDGEYDCLTTVCIRVCVGEDGWPMVRIHWSDADTYLWEDWHQSDREAVDMAAAVCRQPENEGIYLDWLEDRLGVAVRDRDEMMRYIADTNQDTNEIDQLTQVV